MFYHAELQFLRNIFEKFHIQTLLIDPSLPLTSHMDLGLRELLKDNDNYQNTVYDYINPIESNTIYRLSDPFSCCYLFMLLPDCEYETLLGIGPYLSKSLSHESLLEFAEVNNLTTHQIKQLESYYSGIPCLSDGDYLFAVLDSFAERLWGKDNFIISEIANDAADITNPLLLPKEPSDSESFLLNMQAMETRYAFENELMSAVTHGQLHKAEMIFSGFSSASFETRLSDPVRNLKNYCIIMNTLLRKAAEKGGVHPVHLDAMSSTFAKKIELMPSASAVSDLMYEMFRSYCRLVRKHSLKGYSPPIQKTILYIDSDLTANLSLNAMAEMHSLSPAYLSALFKKETGQTLTGFVNKKRIHHAKHLLKSTGLQVQTIAQYCGILDVHYFSKLFKKYTDMTPKEYREAK